MKTFVPAMACLACLTLLVSSGCTRKVSVAPPDAEQARQVLTKALDAWQRGEKPADLQAREAIGVSDRNWREGWKLQSYKLLAGQEERGSSLRIKARLKVSDSKGKAADLNVSYFVGLAPAISIVRDFD